MDYILAVLAFLATTIAILGETKRAERKGLKKIILVGAMLIAISVLFISIFKSYRDQHKVNLSDIYITFYAENLDSHQPDAVILANAPEAFTVDHAFLGNYATRLDFSSVRGVERPSGYRAPNRATLVYHSVNFRKNLFEKDSELPFSYMWDLNDKKLSFRIPVGKFVPIQKAFGESKEEIKWTFRAELIIGDKIFEKKPDENGKIEFTIEDLQ